MTETVYLLISIRTNSCCLVVFCAIDIRAVVKSPVSSSYGSSSPLVEKMPMKARKGSVLRTLVLEEQRALLCPELLQVPENNEEESANMFYYYYYYPLTDESKITFEKKRRS